MTNEEAIKFAKYAPTLAQEPEVQEFYRMCEKALRAQAEAERNEPLTLDDLRKMDGELVWVKNITILTCRGYCFVQKIGNHVILVEPRFYPDRSVKTPHLCADDENQEYGETWLAYRRKPKEENRGYD